MVKPGDWNELQVVKHTDFGIYLDGGADGEILMPGKYVPNGVQDGDTVRCFVYFDTSDRLIATTESPKVKMGECAYLRCKDVSRVGAFLDWGLTKDLFVPFREQKYEMVKGKSYVVFVYQDELSKRIAASSRIDKFLNKSKPEFEPWQSVTLLVAAASEMGITCVVNGTHTGLLYRNEIFRTVHSGEVLQGYVREVRGDGKIDLCLQLPGYDNLKQEESRIIEVLKQHGGKVEVGDKSSPEDIYELFQMSKKNWKRLIGTLYKARKVQVGDFETELLK